MDIDTAAIVFGVLPTHNQLPPQVFACLDQAVELLNEGRVQAIAVIGGYGHGSHKRGQLQPEAQMMKGYLRTKGVKSRAVIMRRKPVTTPEVLREVRRLKIQCGQILTIMEKQERIALLADKIVGGKIELEVKIVPYTLTPEEREANECEGHLLREAKEILKGMPPGNMRAFSKLYSFKHSLWERFLEQLRSEGRLEEFLAQL